MLKKTMLAGGAILALQLPASANPSTVPIGEAFNGTHRFEISQGVSHYLDFSNTNYRITKAYPSNPNQLVGVLLSSGNTQQIVLTWTPNSTAKVASIAIELAGPGGNKTLTVLAKRSKKEPKAIRTVFTPANSSSDFIATGQEDRGESPSTREDNGLLRPNWADRDQIKPIPIEVPSNKKIALKPEGYTPKIKLTPKPVPPIAKTSGRRLIDRSTLSKKALANYLLRGLHRARGLKQINRYHPNYRKSQSMARLLRRGSSIDQALTRSGLPRKTFDDLLGHGGVSRQ